EDAIILVKNTPIILCVQARPHTQTQRENGERSRRTNDKGEKQTDKRQTICKSCRATVAYNSGNTSNMRSHLSHHHPEKLRTQQPTVRKKPKPGQLTLTEVFGAPLPPNSQRAQEITRCIGEYMAKDLRPFSVVDNSGFRRLVNTLEPKYAIPSRPYFSRTVLKSAVLEWGLDNNQGIAVVTDNARNMDVVVREAGLSPHIKCFAHTLNLASKAGLNVNRASRLLGRVRRVAAFFHRISLIVPLKHMIEQSMAQCDEDSSTIAQMKRAILEDFTDRYQGEQNKFLQESTALDPRFRSLHQLNDSQREDVFDRLKLKATQMQNQDDQSMAAVRQVFSLSYTASLLCSSVLLKLPCPSVLLKLPCSSVPLKLPCSSVPLKLHCSSVPLKLPCSSVLLKLPCSSVLLKLPCSSVLLKLPCSSVLLKLPCSSVLLRLLCSALLRLPCSSVLLRLLCSALLRLPCSSVLSAALLCSALLRLPCSSVLLKLPCSSVLLRLLCSPLLSLLYPSPLP
ncbi:hypothetical protein F7725_012018, partial [Dissostichus mawsoni]